MDQVLKSLQGKAFHLSSKIYDSISHKYTQLLAKPIPDLDQKNFHPAAIRQIIAYHREQFLSDEYLQSRINDSTTGTIDHLHAEIAASMAVNLGRKSNYNGYAIELLRLAAHYHDSDRSFPRDMIQGEQAVRHSPSGYREYKKRHAANSAKRAEILTKKAYDNGFFTPQEFIRDLSYLIINHELGGEKENGINLNMPSEVDPALNLNDLSDIMTNSDSLAYFYANILTNWEECGKNKELLSYKVHFMYDRMSTQVKEKLRKSIITSKNHILGSPSDDKDINDIREILLSICI